MYVCADVYIHACVRAWLQLQWEHHCSCRRRPPDMFGPSGKHPNWVDEDLSRTPWEGLWHVYTLCLGIMGQKPPSLFSSLSLSLSLCCGQRRLSNATGHPQDLCGPTHARTRRPATERRPRHCAMVAVLLPMNFPWARGHG